MQTDLAAYYAARASEYERVYAKPERQADLASLRMVVADYFRGCAALEIACGTGYWTQQIAGMARSVLATDIGTEVLEVARQKRWPGTTPVTFTVADAFTLLHIPGDFDAAFAGFWWSHVPRRQLGTFLDQFHARLQSRARVMLIDNRYVEGSSTPILRVDEAGNGYQRRHLADGTTHDVLKNFPSAAEVRETLNAHGATGVDVVELQYFWCATYRVAAA